MKGRRPFSPTFQSHAGSIEAADRIRLRGGFHQFQSHAGSIEAAATRPPSHRTQGFQSHAGSIEANLRCLRVALDAKFQSHAGSIEAASPIEIPRDSLRFNPTLVRLRRNEQIE